MRHAVMVSIIAAALTLAQAVQSEDVEYAGSALWTGATDIVAEGDYAYCSFLNGLVILDISDPAVPTLASRYYFHGHGQDILKSGTYVYIADGEAGVQIVDVSDPLNPVSAGSYDTPGYAWAVRLSGSSLYVADGDQGLVILDVSDPGHPTLTGVYDTWNARDL